MAQWFETDPNRLRWELQALDQMGFHPRVDESKKSQGLLVIHVHATVNGVLTPFRMVYPTGYPHFRPTVFCDTAALARHQNPFERSLCVVDNGDRGWHAGMDGSHMITRAAQLLEDTAAGPAVLHAAEVDAPEPVSAYLTPYQEVGSAFLFPEALGGLLPGGAAWGRFRVKIAQEPTLRAVLTEIEVKEAADGTAPGRVDLPTPLTSTLVTALGAGGSRGGLWVKLETPPPLHEWAAAEPGFNLWSRLLDWAKTESGDLRRLPNLQRDLVAIIYPDEGPSRGEFQPNWAVLLRHHPASTPSSRKPGSHVRALRPFTISGGGYGRVPITPALKGKRVLLIGAGSVGGAIAIELGRAGVKRFTAYDHDVATPPNLVRQEVDLTDIGLPKPLALARKLRLINPEIEVKARSYSIGNVSLNDPARAVAIHDKLVADIQAADLIVVTTGETAPMRHINDLALQFRKPVVFAWALSGAWGGHVFREMPGEACYECLDWWTAEGKVLEANEPEEPAIVYQQGCGLPSFTGAGFDVKAIALAATRMAVQSLIHDEALYPSAPGNHLVINNRGPDEGAAPAIRAESLGAHPSCRHHGHNAKLGSA